jgi:predicted regulator of Ras-like GTPase activity (Roadblock/LC7/MglB family)
MAVLRDVIKGLAARDGVDAVVVLSSDGLPIDHASRGAFDPDAVSALAASFVQGALRLGQSAECQPLSTGVLEFGDRMAIVAPLGDGNLLFLLTSAGTNVGQLLFDLRRHRPALAQLL